jgi:hypothetical protein
MKEKELTLLDLVEAQEDFYDSFYAEMRRLDKKEHLPTSYATERAKGILDGIKVCKGLMGVEA